MGDWLLPVRAPRSRRRGAGPPASRAAALLVLHRLGRRGRRGRLQAGAFGHRATRVRLRRARLPRPRRASPWRWTILRCRTATSRSRPESPASRSATSRRLDRAVGDDTAAVIMETIPATGGYLVPPEGWFAELRRLCDERGALLILDEVQAGLGRTGTLWAFERFGVVPDILVIGKGTSAGVYPIAAACFGHASRSTSRGPLLPPFELCRLRARGAGHRGGRRALRGRGAGQARGRDGRAPARRA